MVDQLKPALMVTAKPNGSIGRRKMARQPSPTYVSTISRGYLSASRVVVSSAST